MSSLLRRLLDRSGTMKFEVATLQLKLLVTMAAADDRINELEVAQIEDFIERTARSDRDEQRLFEQLDLLLTTPPQLEAMLNELATHPEAGRANNRTIQELAHVASSDSEIDHREEFLLDLVCDVFGLAPVALHGTDEHDELDELHDFVQRLAAAGHRAA